MYAFICLHVHMHVGPRRYARSSFFERICVENGEHARMQSESFVGSDARRLFQDQCGP